MADPFLIVKDSLQIFWSHILVASSCSYCLQQLLFITQLFPLANQGWHGWDSATILHIFCCRGQLASFNVYLLHLHRSILCQYFVVFDPLQIQFLTQMWHETLPFHIIYKWCISIVNRDYNDQRPENSKTTKITTRVIAWIVTFHVICKIREYIINSLPNF